MPPMLAHAMRPANTFVAFINKHPVPFILSSSPGGYCDCALLSKSEKDGIEIHFFTRFELIWHCTVLCC